jgi:iron complex transport system substrate-binding protein
LSPNKNLATALQGKSPIAGYVTLSDEKVMEVNPEVSPPDSSPTSMLDAVKK